MMKRRITVVLSLLLTLPLFAATTKRYMVSTRTSSLSSVRIAGDSDAAEKHRVRRFAHVGAFAADLTEAEAAELRQSMSVESVTPVVERHALDLGSDWNTGTTEDTPRFEPQVTPWGVPMINAPQVWPVTRGENVNVAVLDTGIDFEHPDLAAAYAGGYNAIDPSVAPMDDNRHGTHVAGTIAARDNDFGVVGVAPGVKLWAVKVLDQTGKGTDENVTDGLNWTIEQARNGGRWVINMSLGSRADSPVEAKAVGAAIRAGIVICAGSGNRENQYIDYPAKYPGVIAVGAVNDQRQRADFSSYGAGLSVVAPGVDIPSTLRQGLNTSADVRRTAELIDGWGLKGSPFQSERGKLVDCKLGYPEDIPASVKGRVALVKRGEIPFREKARNAKEAGAIAVIVYNNNDDDYDAENWTMDFVVCNGGHCAPDPGWEDYQFPLTVGIPQAEGLKLLNAPGEMVTVGFRAEDYGYLSGTSMATPHVTGLSALLLSLDPTLNAAQVKWIIERTAQRLGTTLWDYHTAFGLVDAYAAAKYVAPQKFNVPAPPPIQSPHRRAVHP